MSQSPPNAWLGLSRNIVYASVSAGSAALLLGVLALAGRLLGEAAYGRFRFALALATIGEALLDLGLHQFTIRELARNRTGASALLRNVLGLKLAPAVVMTLCVWEASRWLRPDADVRLACLLLAISAVMRSYLLTVRAVFQGLEEFGRDSIVALLDRVLLLAFSALILFGGGSLIPLAWAFVASRVIAVAIAFRLLERRIGSVAPSFDFARWRELQRRAIPLGAFLVILNLYSYIDTVMLGVLSTDVETGLYNAAYPIYEGLTYAVAVLSAVLTPRLSAEFVGDQWRHATLARQGLLASAAMAAVVAVAMWLIAEPALTLIFGAAFVPAAGALRILAVGLLAVFPIWILQAVAISVSAERLLLQTTGIGVVVNVVVNLWLIPARGRDGAALATVIGEAVSLALLLYGLRGVLLLRKAS